MGSAASPAESLCLQVAQPSQGEQEKSAELLGILWLDPEVWFKGEATDETKEIESLIEQRATAKKNKDYALADKIRNDLKERGIILEDSASGTTWKKI